MTVLLAASAVHAPIQTILICFAIVFFVLGAIPYEPWQYRLHLISAGLLCWLLVWTGWVS